MASHPSSANKTNRSVLQWLAYLNQSCIPTIAIWSNLLLGIPSCIIVTHLVLYVYTLGNLSRYVTSSVRAFDSVLLNTHNQRTNAISERRMAIVKRTQLGKRFDSIISLLNTMKSNKRNPHSITAQYTVYLSFTFRLCSDTQNTLHSLVKYNLLNFCCRFTNIHTIGCGFTTID